MHATGLRAIAAAALTLAPTPYLVRRHAFHSCSARLNANGNTGGKPAEDDAAAASERSDDASDNSSPGVGENDTDSPTNVQTTGGRLRSSGLSAQRLRQTKQKSSSALPPFDLPNHFLDENVSLYDASRQPRLPLALAEDARTPKVSRLHAPRSSSSSSSEANQDPKPSNETLQSFFGVAIDTLLSRNVELTASFSQSLKAQDGAWDKPEQIEMVTRVWDMIIDSAWHLTDALCPAGDPEYTYRARPFWWWHVYSRQHDNASTVPKDMEARFDAHIAPRKSILEEQILLDSKLDVSLAHAIADLPMATFVTLQKAVQRDLASTPPPNFEPKISRRPMTILSMSGYGGKAIPQSVARHIAHLSGANVVSLDTYDMSELLGDYIGQNLAYSRGTVSMMGFRAAELNGRLAADPDAPPRTLEDDEDDVDLGSVGIRALSLDEEIQRRIKSKGGEIFTKWDSLKVDKVLDHVIRAAEIKSSGTGGKPVLIHIHDIIELSMTMEGSLLLARLRGLIDEAWHRGTKISILGTSASEEPSDDYYNAVRDFTGTDFVCTRHIQPQHAMRQTAVPPTYDLQKLDYVVENMSNLNRMLRALDAKHPQIPLASLSDAILTYASAPTSKVKMLRDSILTAPELFHLASACRAGEGDGPEAVIAGLAERFRLGPLRQLPGQDLSASEQYDAKSETSESSKTGDNAHADARALPKKNEYEKRIASGQVNRDNLRVSFADVHAPAETISALKLLTSLALVRPDAFSYGVLASDKIPGCLLYGPPGTGKTMLAKAVAKESGANMLEISGATINDKWVGESEKLIRAVFTLAKKLSPCVVFIDEADSLLANRGMFSNRGSHREHINQFLKEWDGMEETNAFIMVATNRPFDLDEAVLRRLPRKILVDLPLRDDRASILGLQLRGETLDPDVDISSYADRTPYYSGSDLKNVCVAAAMAAVEEENEAASRHDGPDPYVYPAKRTLRKAHFEKALQQIPASISEDMDSLKQIRKFDEEYGNGRRRGGKKKSMGFGVLDDKIKIDATDARIRQ